jgi:hypothetical protein
VLLALQAECVDWLEVLPDSLRGTATADALEAIADLDLTELAEIKPPRGLRSGLTCNEATNFRALPIQTEPRHLTRPQPL